MPFVETRCCWSCNRRRSAGRGPNISRHKARQALAESALTRKRGLAAERIAPQREVQEAEAEAAGALAAIRAASSSLHAMGVGLPENSSSDTARASFYTLRSPVGGTVIERSAVNGQMLDPGTRRFGSATCRRSGSRFMPSSATPCGSGQGRRRGQLLGTSWAGLHGRGHAGRPPGVERESRTIDVRIDVRNRDDSLRPGMSATARVPIGNSDTPMLTVPVSSVQRVGEPGASFSRRDGRHFEIRRIGRGRDLGSEVEVLSGLRPVTRSSSMARFS